MKRPSSSQTIGFCAPKVAKSSWIAFATTALWSTDSWLLLCFSVLAGDTRGLVVAVVVVAVERVVSGEPSSSSSSTTFRLLSAAATAHTALYGSRYSAAQRRRSRRLFSVALSLSVQWTYSVSFSLSLSWIWYSFFSFSLSLSSVSCRRRRGFRANDRPWEGDSAVSFSYSSLFFFSDLFGDVILSVSCVTVSVALGQGNVDRLMMMMAGWWWWWPWWFWWWSWGRWCRRRRILWPFFLFPFFMSFFSSSKHSSLLWLSYTMLYCFAFLLICLPCLLLYSSLHLGWLFFAYYPLCALLAYRCLEPILLSCFFTFSSFLFSVLQLLFGRRSKPLMT